jgi:hypothetical protein
MDRLTNEQLRRLEFLELTQPKLVELVRKLKEENTELRKQIEELKPKTARIKWNWRRNRIKKMDRCAYKGCSKINGIGEGIDESEFCVKHCNFNILRPLTNNQ